MQIKMGRKAGFTLVEIMIVVAIIGLLAAIAIPNFIKARESSQKNACVNNLRQLQGAKQTWALENQKVGSDVPNAGNIYGSTAYIRVEPKCPTDNLSYTLTAVDQNDTCTGGHAGHALP